LVETIKGYALVIFICGTRTKIRVLMHFKKNSSGWNQPTINCRFRSWLVRTRRQAKPIFRTKNRQIYFFRTWPGIRFCCLYMCRAGAEGCLQRAKNCPTLLLWTWCHNKVPIYWPCYPGEDIAFRFIIDDSSLRDFGFWVIGLLF
jgi:hypothetical protein